MQEIGTISELNLYPVKSMRSIRVEQADCYWYGLNGDRKYAFVQQAKNSGFPWLTARELADMLWYQPSFLETKNILNSAIKVKTPEGKNLALESPELKRELSKKAKLDIFLLKLNRGTYDCMPLSIMTTASLEKLECLLGDLFDKNRFRYNILIDSKHLDEAWLGKTLYLGNELSLTIVYPTKRCMMINLDPQTNQSNLDVLKLVSQHMNSLAGVYATVKHVGQLAVGDTVRLKS